MRFFSFALLCLSLVVFAAGCQPGDSKTDMSNTKTGGQNDHDHGDHDHGDHDHGDHDHDHGDHDHEGIVHGPHNGHMVDLGDAPFKAEWCHYSSNTLVDVYVLDAEAKNEMPIKADSITIRQTTGDDPETFTLEAVNPDADGKTAQFQIDSQRLLTAMNAGVEVVFNFDGKETIGKIAPHAPH